MADGLFVAMDKAIMGQLQQATQGQMMIYASGVSSLANAAIALFIVVKGYQTLAGKLQTPIADVVWELTKMSIIMIFVNNIGGYLDMAISAIQGLRDGFSGEESVWATLDKLWGVTQELAQAVYDLDDSTYVSVTGAIGSELVWLGTIITVLVSAIVFLSAEVTILLMTVTAPIFIFCLMFGFLRQMFNNWLQLIFSSILTVLFATLVINSGISYYASILEQINAGASKYNLMTMGALACVAGVISGFVVWLSSRFATQLAGVGVDGAIQGMAAVGLGSAAFGASKALSQGRGMAENIGAKAQSNLTQKPNREGAEDAMKARVKNGIERMRKK